MPTDQFPTIQVHLGFKTGPQVKNLFCHHPMPEISMRNKVIYIMMIGFIS